MHLCEVVLIEPVLRIRLIGIGRRDPFEYEAIVTRHVLVEIVERLADYVKHDRVV